MYGSFKLQAQTKFDTQGDTALLRVSGINTKRQTWLSANCMWVKGASQQSEWGFFFAFCLLSFTAKVIEWTADHQVVRVSVSDHTAVQLRVTNTPSIVACATENEWNRTGLSCYFILRHWRWRKVGNSVLLFLVQVERNGNRPVRLFYFHILCHLRQA